MKKSLLILVQNGMLAPPQQLPFLLDGVGCLMLTVGDGGGGGRNRFGAPLEFKDVGVRRPPHFHGFHQRRAVLLAEP